MNESDHDQQGLEAKAREDDTSADDDDDDDAASPFDHPAFLPVLLWGLAAWFGYDGWINQDPEMLEHVAFNRWGFGILAVLGVYFTIQSVREMRADRETGETGSGA
jgi:hypothetical protein